MLHSDKREWLLLEYKTSLIREQVVISYVDYYISGKISHTFFLPVDEAMKVSQERYVDVGMVTEYTE